MFSTGPAPVSQPRKLDLGVDDRAVELRAQRDRVADVVAVPVGEKIASTRSGLHSPRRARRVPVQERVDVDALAARGVDAERRMPEPGECR